MLFLIIIFIMNYKKMLLFGIGALNFLFNLFKQKEFTPLKGLPFKGHV